jgi:hypothetical protein
VNLDLTAIFMKESQFKKDLTTITVELGFLGKFVLLSLKTCTLYQENLRSVHPTAPV